METLFAFVSPFAIALQFTLACMPFASWLAGWLAADEPPSLIS